MNWYGWGFRPFTPPPPLLTEPTILRGPKKTFFGSREVHNQNMFKINSETKDLRWGLFRNSTAQLSLRFWDLFLLFFCWVWIDFGIISNEFFILIANYKSPYTPYFVFFLHISLFYVKLSDISPLTKSANINPIFCQSSLSAQARRGEVLWVVTSEVFLSKWWPYIPLVGPISRLEASQQPLGQPRPPIFLFCSISPHFFPAHWCFQNTNETKRLVLFLLNLVQIFKPQIVWGFQPSKTRPPRFCTLSCAFQGGGSSADPNPHNCSSMSWVNLSQFERWGIFFLWGDHSNSPNWEIKKWWSTNCWSRAVGNLEHVIPENGSISMM